MEPSVRPTPLSRMEGMRSPEQSNMPYARVGEDGVEYAGPHRSDLLVGPLRVVLFGPDAEVVAKSAGQCSVRAAVQGSNWNFETTDPAFPIWG